MREAAVTGADQAVFAIHVLWTPELNRAKLRRNEQGIETFLRLLTNEARPRASSFRQSEQTRRERR